jgi:uncharacterized membrane protein
MLAALISLAGLFVAVYLTMYKLGVIGDLACSIGSCETVQLSQWASFLGLPVAAWGVGFYAIMFVIALAGVQERFERAPHIPIALTMLSGWGVLFSLWLTWLELFVIDAICTWCVVSAVLVVALFIVSMLDLRETVISARTADAAAGTHDSRLMTRDS